MRVENRYFIVIITQFKFFLACTYNGRVLSTAIPTLIDATVIVIISNGIFNNPNIPIMLEATNMLGIKPIIIALIDLNINRNIIPITVKTIINEFNKLLNND